MGDGFVCKHGQPIVPNCIGCDSEADADLERIMRERDEARENLARGRFNVVWLTVGWCGLIEVYKHRADGFEGIESYVKLVRTMEKKSIITAEWALAVNTEATQP